MKKLILALITFSFLYGSAHALGINVGVAMNTGVYAGEATEHDTDSSGNVEKATEDAIGVDSFASFFIEKTLGERFAIGYEYADDVLSSNTAETVKTNNLEGKADDGVGGTDTNKVQVDFESMNTFYVTFNLNENVYVKAGVVEVDVITNEVLGTGSQYGNTSLDGDTFGIGYDRTFDNNFFIRVEGTYLDLGGTSVTATNTTSGTSNKVVVENVEGAQAKFAIGKSF